MLRGEVAAVVGVEHVGNPTKMPARIVLAPDRLAQSKRRLCGRRRLKKQEIASNGTAVVIPCLSGCFSTPQAVDWRGASPDVSENLARISVAVLQRRGLSKIPGLLPVAGWVCVSSMRQPKCL